MRIGLAPARSRLAFLVFVALSGCNERKATSPKDADSAVAGNVVETAPTPRVRTH